MKECNNIYCIFDELEKRKAMFLGNGYTFQSLESFTTGYLLAANKQQLEQPDTPNFGYFSTWLLGHIDENYGLAGGFFWQISNRNLNDDIKAFDDFFYLLRVFKTSVINTKSTVFNSQARNFSIDGSVKRFIDQNPDEPPKVPYSVRWISITYSTTIWIEFLDENNKVFNETWYLNPKEAKDALEKEFGGYLRMF
ncbi:hypothetical protein SAMN05216464_109237 [Mucilaginibacter pineti]|uniref:Uncharacterized protein n=1 Tax=Mucilaginibacter pineti TaxID=1391627 RepID=A0A1G7FVM2_9SPHI|nr:hypothetical protein [Mucilaginibacter pineti]SDE79950.1 hypothetical protein SAMN05216464_109237 [Mucilaginibacter pineti]